MRRFKHTVSDFVRGIRQIRTYIPHLFTAILAHSLITAAMPFVTVWLGASLVSELFGARDIPTLVTRTLVLLCVQTLATLADGALKRAKEAKWERLYRSVNSMIDDKLLSLDHAAFSDVSTRSLAADVKEHTEALGRGLVALPEMFQDLANGVFGTVGALILTLSLSAHHTVVFVASILLFGATWGASALAVTARHIADDKTRHVVSLDRSYYTLYDMMFDVGKATDIRLYRQDRLIDARLHRTDRLFFEKGGLKRQPLCEWLDTVSDFLPLLWAGGMILLITLCAENNAVDSTSALCFLGTVLLMTRHANDIRNGLENAARNTPYVRTALSFLDIPPFMYRGSLTTEKRSDRRYTLEFDNVSFCYPSRSQPALDRVSVCLSPGKRIAVVGENGSGKSTFAKLLCRLYDPDEGAILLGGIDIRKYRSEEYADLVSVVFQDYRLLAFSPTDNICANRPFDKTRLIRCLEAVGYPLPQDHVESTLTAPLDPDTMSPVNSQKIAIARALYKDAPFIVLDEPTASLDPVAEAEIYAHLDRIVEDRTAVFISHRLSSCRFCDEILVFDSGRVIQRGTHRELLADPKGKYYALWHAQAQYYQ